MGTMTYTLEYMLKTPGRRLSAMPTDPLSEVLSLVRLTGALLFSVDACGAFAVAEQPTADKFAPLLPPATSHIIAFHIVLAGTCWYRCSGGAWGTLASGRALVIPNGDAHALADRAQRRPQPFEAWLGARSIMGLRKIRLGSGAGGQVRLLCGFLGCERRAFEPLFAALPAGFAVTLGERHAALLQYAVKEALDDRPGAASLRVRLAELLFTESLRVYMQDLPEHARGWLAGARDPHVGRALRAMHAAPTRDWSVDALARECACSRSQLAARFRALLGVPPMHYLTTLRLQLAAQRLREHAGSLARVAEEVGYDSGAAFQRAFKRRFGQPPAAWRRQFRA